jgi:site-specific recombinase XerD
MLLVLRNTGLRKSELFNLKWEDVDFTKNLLLVRNRKGNSYHSIPMNEELRTTLLFLRDNYITPKGEIVPREEHQREHVFCLPDGRPHKSFRTSFEKAVRKSGLRDVSPHTLRHTFASHLVMNGVDLPTVQHLLGHKTIIVTLMYAHLSSEHIARAVEKLSWAKPELKVVSE